MTKKKDDKPREGEQLDLIDVHDKNMKPIIKVARLYKKLQLDRIAALQAEIEQKQKLLALIKESELQALEGGVIKFECDGVTISVTPRDELVKVKDSLDD